MNATRQPKLAFGSKLWLGLAGYVLAVDVYALMTEKETLSEALGRGLVHPRRRWPVTIAWILTTKHLFFRNFLSWLDPFALIALCVAVIKKLTNRRE